MSSKLVRSILGMAVVALTVCAGQVRAQAPDITTPQNDAPNPYRTVENHFLLPPGQVWGSTSTIAIDPDGHSVWIAQRCGANSCYDARTGEMSPINPVMHFAPDGHLLESFGAGLLFWPHGFAVDSAGNVWVTDGHDNSKKPPRGSPQARQGRMGPYPGATKGNQVWKFSRDGGVLMTIGKPGGAAPPECCYQPNDVLVAPNGDIFVAEGHSDAPGNVARIFKFDPTGKILTQWGKLGTGPGEFDQPHALAMDANGLLYVGDRNNNRVQVFDQNGKFIRQFHQWSRPSGLYIRDGILYSADSESESVSRNHDGWERGIRWGKISDGKIIGFIPDPDVNARGTSAAEGVAVDVDGNIYGAEVGPHDVKMYVRNK